MYQTTTAVWNKIAETQPLRTKFAKRLFHLNTDQMETALAKEEDKLVAKGLEPATAAAYLVVAPLLWENEAIAAFVRENPGTMGALPNLVDVSEAVMVASADYPMTASQQEKLAELLRLPNDDGVAEGLDEGRIPPEVVRSHASDATREKRAASDAAHSDTKGAVTVMDEVAAGLTALFGASPTSDEKTTTQTSLVHTEGEAEGRLIRRKNGPPIQE